ncbi:MAG: MFS transporter [Hyphomicrobiaceae bacterium]
MTTAALSSSRFYGWRVVAAAFVLAIFGWGMGFYGPPVFLSVLTSERGWSLALVSSAITVHYLTGALVAGNLPALNRRLGIAGVTKVAALSLSIGVFAWSLAAEPWQLFMAALLSGAGWSAMSAAAVNAIVSPWFVRARPTALAMAYNGGSVGGIIFSPLWVLSIGALGFPLAAAVIGLVMVITMWTLAGLVFSRTPQQMGLAPDGDAPNVAAVPVVSASATPLPGALLWRDLKFLTLAAAMSFGLIAQIGLASHLVSLLMPALGLRQAGLAMGLATALAIGGRTLTGWLMPAGSGRRLVGCTSYALQLAGSLVFVLAAGTSVPLLLLGVVLFGLGFGNATSLSPLIAQVEFQPEDVARAVPLIVAISQATYAFAPAAFGLIRELPVLGTTLGPGEAPALFLAAALVQGLAIAAMLVGWRR